MPDAGAYQGPLCADCHKPADGRWTLGCYLCGDCAYVREEFMSECVSGDNAKEDV